MLFRSVFVLMIGIYMTMLVLTLPAISEQAGNLPAFDMRPGGYSFEEAQAFLAALSPKGKAIYLGLQSQLDLIYPFLLAVFTGSSILLLVPPRWGGWGKALALLAIPGAAFDYLENSAVALMLNAGPDALTPRMVEFASRMTFLKSVTTSLSLSVLLVLFFGWLWRRFRPAPQRSG